MVRVARERIADLFALAEREARAGSLRLSDRYVRLARKIGMRYNVRLLPEFSELYCRGCSSFWVEGVTVRTRLRAGRRVRTCAVCGRLRRAPYRSRPRKSPEAGVDARRQSTQPEVGLSEGIGPDGDDATSGAERDGR
jgi:ribonuclease P protein subunit RPR2